MMLILVVPTTDIMSLSASRDTQNAELPRRCATQEFQTSIFFFLQLFFYHQLPNPGVFI